MKIRNVKKMTFLLTGRTFSFLEFGCNLRVCTVCSAADNSLSTLSAKASLLPVNENETIIIFIVNL